MKSSVVDPDPNRSALIWLFWIRIHTGNADPDPSAWKLTRLNKLTLFPAFQKGFCTFVVCRFFFTYYRYLLSCKILTFCDFKVWQRSGSGPHWLGSLDPDRDPYWNKKLDPDPNWNKKLDPDPHWNKKLDPDPHSNKKLGPDPHWNKCGYTTLMNEKTVWLTWLQ